MKRSHVENTVTRSNPTNLPRYATVCHLRSVHDVLIAGVGTFVQRLLRCNTEQHYMTRPAPPASPFGSAQGGPGPSTQKLRIKTPPFSHHGIAFSPFFEDRIAVASGANFGLVGNGRVHVMTFGRGAGLSVIKTCVRDWDLFK